MRRVNSILLVISSFIGVLNTHAQVSVDALKTAYLIKIIDNFEWESVDKPINIGLVTSNKNFQARIQQYTKDKSINGREINSETINGVKDFDRFNIIYVAEEKTKFLESYLKALDNKKILLVSYLALSTEFSMVNFYTSYDKKLKFKINSKLLESHGFKPSSLMLILGGSDNDILSLLEQKDLSIEKERQAAISLKEENQSKAQKLKLLNGKIADISKDLEIKNKEVISKNLEVEEINKELSKQKRNLYSISKQIKENSKELEEREIQIKKQETKIKEQAIIYQDQQNEIKRRINVIDEQDEILEQQGNLLSLKQKYLNYAFIFSLVLLGILVFAIISFLGKRKSSFKLERQNEKLQKTLGELQTAQAKLVQNEKMASLGMVTAGMAHEINNPITFVYTGATILKSEINDYSEVISEILNINQSDLSKEERQNKINELKLSSDETENSINQIVNDIELGAKRVTEIVNSLQNFSKLNESDVKSTDIIKSIESTLTILGSHARQKKIKIKENHEKESVIIECFPASINQVFVNLISNAIDATPPKVGVINIKVVPKVKYCEIIIEDNGSGISPEHLGKIFDPFFTTKTIGEGTGLGLSISYNIIKKHHGNIKVDSSLGRGTKFTIELPYQYKNELND